MLRQELLCTDVNRLFRSVHVFVDLADRVRQIAHDKRYLRNSSRSRHPDGRGSARANINVIFDIYYAKPCARRLVNRILFKFHNRAVVVGGGEGGWLSRLALPPRPPSSRYVIRSPPPCKRAGGSTRRGRPADRSRGPTGARVSVRRRSPPAVGVAVRSVFSGCSRRRSATETRAVFSSFP